MLRILSPAHPAPESKTPLARVSPDDFFARYAALSAAAAGAKTHTVRQILAHPELGPKLERLELEFMIYSAKEQIALMQRLARHAGQGTGPRDLWLVFSGKHSAGDSARTDLVGKKPTQLDWWRDLYY